MVVDSHGIDPAGYSALRSLFSRMRLSLEVNCLYWQSQDPYTQLLWPQVILAIFFAALEELEVHALVPPGYGGAVPYCF